MKEKTPVSSKITEVLAMFMWFVTLGQGFVQGHGLGRFSSHTNMVEVDGVVPFVLFRSDDNSITRHCFINSHIDTDEETDDNETDYYDSNYLVTLLHLPVIPSDYGCRIDPFLTGSSAFIPTILEQ